MQDIVLATIAAAAERQMRAGPILTILGTLIMSSPARAGTAQIAGRCD
jgi:hypothetical protein